VTGIIVVLMLRVNNQVKDTYYFNKILAFNHWLKNPKREEKETPVSSSMHKLWGSLPEAERKAAAVRRDLDSFLSAPLESIPTDLPLAYPIYVRLTGRLILFRPQGDHLEKKRYATLRENIDTIYIPRSCLGAYLSELEQVDEQGLSQEADLLRVRFILMAYQQLWGGKKEFGRLQIQKFEQLAKKLAGGIYDNFKIAGKILRRYDDSKLYFVNHTLNVAIYSASIGIKLNLPRKSVQMLTFGALVHNVGNLFVPSDILFKPGNLNNDEWEHIHSHPMRGAKLLQKLSASNEIVLTAMQHHERVDGDGYPNRSNGNDIHIYAKIVSISDVYDALTNQGPYQNATIPETAILKMRHMSGKFDHRILKMIG